MPPSTGEPGGALFNSFGEVIGINTAKNIQTGIEGLGFAIPINDAKPVVESLINFGYVRGRTKIGIQINDISAEMAEYYDLVEGVFVAMVEPGSSADKAGLRNEDIIIAANGEEAKTVADLIRIKKTGPGDTMTLTVVRNDRKVRVTIILEEDIPSGIPVTATINPMWRGVASPSGQVPAGDVCLFYGKITRSIQTINCTEEAI